MRGLGGVLLAITLIACTAEVRLGDRCEYSSECPAPYRCAFARCRAECRVNVDCPLGAVCQLDLDGIGSCSLADDPGCDGASDCADGLACVNRACVDACDADADCADGNECWSFPAIDAAFCVDPRARPDAGMPVERDGGIDDSGPTDAAVDGSLLDAAVDLDGGRSCPAAGCADVVDIALAHGHVCALTAGGAVWCWGSDETGEASGRLEDRETCGVIPCRTDPTRIELTGASKAIALAAGDQFTCTRRQDERAECWGTNASGALGRTSEGPAVELVSGLAGAIFLAAGNGFALAITSTDMVGWGDNRSSQLRLAPDPSPLVVLTPDAGVIAVGGHHACVLRRGVDVSCWGSNGLGQLGRTLTGAETTSAEEGLVEGLAGTPERLIAGAARTCVIDDGALTCWGYDLAGERGPPTLVPSEPIAELWSAPSSLVFCGVTTTGTPVCFGRSEGEALWPSGTGNVRATPVAMHASLPTPVREITTDGATGCLLDDGGAVWCWGANELGQLGRGWSGTAERTPARVIIPAD